MLHAHSCHRCSISSILTSGVSSGQVGYSRLNSTALASERAALQCDLNTGFFGEPAPLFGPQLEKATCKDSSFLLIVGSPIVFAIVRDGKKRRGVAVVVVLMSVCVRERESRCKCKIANRATNRLDGCVGISCSCLLPFMHHPNRPMRRLHHRYCGFDRRSCCYRHLFPRYRGERLLRFQLPVLRRLQRTAKR